MKKVKEYPKKINDLMKLHIRNKETYDKVIVYYCNTKKEIDDLAKRFDLSLNTVKELNHKYKTVTFYYIAYGKPSYINTGTGELNDFNKYYVFYTILNKG